MERLCGQEIYTYGGELHFDSSMLRRPKCSITINGIGPNDTMLSLSVTSFNVTEGCYANISLNEPPKAKIEKPNGRSTQFVIDKCTSVCLVLETKKLHIPSLPNKLGRCIYY